jgi:hypothetical protein
MKTLFYTLVMCCLVASSLVILSGCDDNEDPAPQLTGESKTYTLRQVSDPDVSGTVTFAQRDDDRVLITLELDGTESGNTHPAHIHANSAAAGGGILLDLTPVDGADGKSETVVNALNDGTAVSYEDFLNFDGYVNVHKSEADIATLIAQGDIGANELTGDTKVYTLTPVADLEVTGTATFAKRKKGTTLVTVALDGTQPGATHASHIHANTIAQGGGIVINLNSVDGTTGMARTSVDTLNNGTAITYDDLLNFNGYLNVHSGSSFVAQADIGGNELTTTSKVYTLTPVADQTVTGTATFTKRKKGTTLVTVALNGTQPGTVHPSHIHANTIAQGGGIVINLEGVDGATGMAQTSVDTLNNGTAITYEELLNFNGYLNVHQGSSFVVQGDIGANELTGEQKVYTLFPVMDPSVTGTATFAKRKKGTTLVTVAVTGTQAGVNHPSHIHANTIVEGGSIVINLKSVDGATGMASTSVDTLNTGAAITYDELLNFNGYLNVHSGGSFVAQGDIGANEFTGDQKVYTLKPVADPNVSGTATFQERKNGSTLVTVDLENTQAGASHPSHIHANTIAEGGGIVINLNNVDGTTGMARTNVKQLNSGTAITYDELLDFNGYLNVHAAGGTFVVQGDIGQNELTGVQEEYNLNELGGSGVSGTATFAERKNGKTQITLALTGTTAGGDHPAHIHANNAATGGGIVLDLKNVSGATGKSVTSANALKDGTAITYAQLIAYNGHINVHLSPTELGTRIAQGNIGSNVP